jgi:type II secretion system protein G
MMKLYKNEKGFTLVEILIVVLIIGVIAALAIPNLMSAQKTAWGKTCAANRATLEAAAELYRMQDGNFPGTVADMWTPVAGYEAVMTREMDCPMVKVTAGSPATQYQIDEDGNVTCDRADAGDHPQ